MIQTQLIYCGDNLQKLKDLPDGCVDLIYIDPPFNSNRNYEVFWGDAKEKRSFDDRFGAVEHYIHWMRPRVMELYRVLKKTGSFYYHCDGHASHYIKVMLDQVFSINQYMNEIVWQRTSAHNDPGRYGRIHDVLLFYTKSKKYTWNTQYEPQTDSYFGAHDFQRDENGRLYRKRDATAPAHGTNSGQYEWNGKRPPTGRMWSYTEENMRALDEEGRLVYTKTGMPRLKIFVEDLKGVPLQDIWVAPSLWLNSAARERIGYPTQKPLSLLNRIVESSSNKGDVILDAFCGCGTTIEAAQRLGRRWIGIDISPTACRVMAQRLVKECHVHEGKDFWVRDLPKTTEQLRKYPPFEFENWAVTALNTVLVNGQAIANRAQVGDFGIDGRIYPADMVKEKKAGYDLFGEMDRWFPVQVKQKDKAGRPDIDSFETAMQRQQRVKGFFVSFAFTSEAITEIKRANREMNLEIIPVTVSDILAEEVTLRL